MTQLEAPSATAVMLVNVFVFVEKSRVLTFPSNNAPCVVLSISEPAVAVVPLISLTLKTRP